MPRTLNKEEMRWLEWLADRCSRDASDNVSREEVMGALNLTREQYDCFKRRMTEIGANVPENVNPMAAADGLGFMSPASCSKLYQLLEERKVRWKTWWAKLAWMLLGTMLGIGGTLASQWLSHTIYVVEDTQKQPPAAYRGVPQDVPASSSTPARSN